MEERIWIRQGGVLVGYFEDGTAVLDSAFLAVGSHRDPRRTGGELAAGRRKAAGANRKRASDDPPCAGLAAETRGRPEQEVHRVLGIDGPLWRPQPFRLPDGV